MSSYEPIFPPEWSDLTNMVNTRTESIYEQLDKLPIARHGELYGLLRQFKQNISWHVPTPGLIDLLVENSPVIGVCSGLGYTESLARDAGCDIIATDIDPKRMSGYRPKTGARQFMKIVKQDAVAAVMEYPDRTVFLGWPPYESTGQGESGIAYDVAVAMEVGQTIIYIGEGYGGCTGDDFFHHALDTYFDEIQISANVAQFFSIHDHAMMYQKRDIIDMEEVKAYCTEHTY